MLGNPWDNMIKIIFRLRYVGYNRCMILVLHGENTRIVDGSPGQAAQIGQVGARTTAVVPRRRDGGMTEA